MAESVYKVIELIGTSTEGKVEAYRAKVKVSFKYEASDE
jgi:flavin-binding protein dodecin